ncbi:MAG: hypothetical protein EKK53_21435 [Burkholderiales bacterium]|nr:MAG: hypothetical protein EKK53_21435 [Burkholderiales bacterium]
MTSITPTIGRKIYYVPTLEDVALGMTRQGATEHVDATVVYVDVEAGTVNLRITDHVGATFVRHGIAVADEPQPGQAHWMGYQLSQAGVKPEPVAGGALTSMGSIVDSLARGAETSAIQRALAVPVSEDGTVKVADIQAAVRGDIQLQDRSLLPDGHPDKVYPQAAQSAAPSDQTGTTVIGEPDAATSAGSQPSTDAPLVAGNVVGD